MAVKAATPGRSIIPYVSDSKSITAALIKTGKQQEEEKKNKSKYCTHIEKETEKEKKSLNE